MVAVLGVGLLLVGCDSTSNADEDGAALTGDMAVFADALGTLSEGASLSDDETTSLRDLISSYADEADEPGALWYLAADIHDELTDEQIEQLKARLEERRERMQERGGPGPMGRHGPRHKGPHLRWMKKLDLTDAQKEELRAIRADYHDSLKAFREECRAGTVDEADAERWRELRKEMREAMRAILTDEQRDRLETLREERRERREAIREARVEALDLTDEQQAQFDSLRDQHEEGDRIMRFCNRDEAPNPDERPGASILTEEQMEIVMIHHILLRSKMQDQQGPGGPHGPGGPPGGP